jgi:hypothetical protein
MSRYTHPLARLVFRFARGSVPDYREGVAGGNGPLRWVTEDGSFLPAAAGRRPPPLGRSLLNYFKK